MFGLPNKAESRDIKRVTILFKPGNFIPSIIAYQNFKLIILEHGLWSVGFTLIYLKTVLQN